MLTLLFFGISMEREWGAKRFLIFYFATGFGALLLHSVAWFFEVQNFLSVFTPEEVQFLWEGATAFANDQSVPIGQFAKMEPYLQEFHGITNVGFVVGASGAIYGVLAAFAVYYPDREIYLYFLFPVKAKIFIPIMIGIALYAGLNPSQGDNVAHFAHLGGAIFGFLIARYWKRNRYRVR